MHPDLIYKELPENPTDIDRVEIFIKVLINSTSPHFVDYPKLGIEGSADEKVFNEILKNTGLIEPTTHGGPYNPSFKLNGNGYTMMKRFVTYSKYAEAVDIQKEEELKLKDKTSEMQSKINSLTLESLEYEKDNRKLKEQLATLQIDLSEAQKNDIPVNATDRKTNVIWQIIATISVVVAFLLKLFGVKGWL